MSASAPSAATSLLAAFLAAHAVRALPAAASGARPPRHHFSHVAAAVVAPDSMAGDLAELEGRPIRRVRIEARNIFDPLPGGHLRGAYQLANTLHVRTRESTVRELLLLEPGERWSAEHAAEAMRRLRELDFLVPDRFEARRIGDSVDVVVRTTDTWTTSPQFDFQSSDGTSFMTVSFAEDNVLGLGKGLSATYHEEPAGVTRALEWNDPALFGSRARFDFMVAKGGSGTANHLDGGIPFYVPSSPTALFADWSTASAVKSLYSHGVESANFDQRREDTDVMWGRGLQGKERVTRWVMSFHSRDRHFGASRLVGAPPVPPEFGGGSEDLKLNRVAIEGQWWRPHFIERVGVNRMTRIEDFDIGSHFSLKLGLAPRLLGSTATEGYVQAIADAGIPAGNAFGLVHAAFETRYRRSVREEIQTLSARWVAPLSAHQTLVVAGLGANGIRVMRDFQLSAGGLSGLRGYPLHELTGHQLWRVNAEDRFIGPELWALMSVGAAAFYDAAHMTGPGAEGTGWHQDAGVGLRLGFSRSALNQVVRLDLAIPIEPTRDGHHRVVFSFGSSQAF